MPTLAAITLADGQATPVNVVFTPDRSEGNVFGYNDGQDPASAQRTMQLSITYAKKKTDFTVVSCLFREPYVDPTTGALLWFDQGRTEYRFGYSSLLAKRKNLFAFTKNLHANADWKTMVQDRQGML